MTTKNEGFDATGTTEVNNLTSTDSKVATTATATTEGNPQSGADNNAAASITVSGSGPVVSKEKRKPAILIFFRKMYILLWKCFIQRRRAGCLLFWEMFVTVGFGLGLLYFGTIANAMEIDLMELNLKKDTVANYAELIKAVPENGEVYYTPVTSETKKIIEKILEKLLKFERNNIRFTGTKNEAAIEAHYNNIAFDGEKIKNFVGAIVFQKYTKSEVKYKLRFPLVGGKNRTAFILPPVNQLFFKEEGNLKDARDRILQKRGSKAESKDDEVSYYSRGVLGLQILIDESAAVTLTSKEFQGEEVILNQFPFYGPASLKSDDWVWVLAVLVFCISVIVLFVFVMLNSFLTRNVVGEKETGVKELMKLSGYPGWMQWLALYIIAIIMGVVYFSLLLIFWFTIPAYDSEHPMIRQSDPTVWFFVLMLGAIADVAIVLFVSAFFNSASLANGAITICSLVASGGAPYLVTTNFFAPDSNPAILLAMSLLPQCCLSLGVSFLVIFEAVGGGAQWNKMWMELPDHPGICLGHVVIMFLVDTVIYVLLGTYFESILPSEHGVRKHWYYPVSPIINLIKNRKPEQNSLQIQDSVSQATVGGFEKREVSKPVGVIVKNIVKKFDQKIAVNNVSMTMYDGEIFALLGHNGAGKTTLISILSGMISATSGTATIYGYDIKEDVETIRKSLGLCPQHNMLFNNLTVMEHLKLFGAMKGKDFKSVEVEARSLLEMMQLYDAEKSHAGTLSGGQKRKLCLAMALVGGAKILIIDECSSGMDPEARRAIWDILLKVRGERTILLTTHFMEEADVLGDHIAIMAEGKIQCSGTPAFLKSYYGTGFTLKVSLLPGGDKNAVLLTVQMHIPNASMKPIKMDHEMFITLPRETATSSALSGLFSTLTAKKQELKIEALGLSMSSMDEVFVKVGELASTGISHDAGSLAPNPSAGAALQQTSQSQIQADPNQDPEQPEGAPDPPTTITPVAVKSKSKRFSIWIQKILMQILAIILKQVFYLRRRMFLTLVMFTVPAVLVTTFTLDVSYRQIAPEKPSIPLELNFNSYTNPTPLTIYTATTKDLQTRVKKAINSDSKEITKGKVKIALWKAAINDVFFKRKYIVAGEMNEKRFTAWFNKFALHSPPLAINLASNSRAPQGFRITVSIHPLETPESLLIDAAQTVKNKSKGIIEDLDRVILITLFGLAFCFIVQPITERLNKSKHLQLMTGINPGLYWIVTFIFDLLLWTLVVTIMVMLMAACEKYKFFSTNHGLATFFLVLEGFGIFVIPLIYLVSHLPKSVTGGIILLMLILDLPHIGVLIAAIRPTEDLEGKGNQITWLLRFFPHPAARYSCKYIVTAATVNAKCNYFTDKVTQVLCRSASGDEFNDLKGCCSNCKALKVPCFKPEETLTWEMPFVFKNTRYFDVAGIWQTLICEIVLGMVALFAHILIDFGLLRFIRGKFMKGQESDFVNQVQDDDVQAENQRVIEMIMNNRKHDDAFIVDNLCKRFGRFAAVSKIRFGIHHGECFGLLGINGAGKTTTFRMITGDEIPSFGDAYEGSISLSKNRRTFLSNIGYCPQFDAFMPTLTGRENLLIFALLRGMKFSQGRLEAQKWLGKVGLEKDGNVKAQNYSGGMKRRLSAAVAMLGDPPLILMDEPTSGVDPISRRQFWKVLESLRDSKNQSVILTSHSMDECEMLCSRLGIMVNGQLQCLGGVQHLKHKFAQGYTLTLKLKNGIPGEKIENDGGALAEMDKVIKEKFLPCLLKEQHDTLLKYQILNTNLGWDLLYRTLEELKNSYSSIIEDYSVSETTLEEVFLSFAQKQDELNKGKKKLQPSSSPGS